MTVDKLTLTFGMEIKLRTLDKQGITEWLHGNFAEGNTDNDDGRRAMAVHLLEFLKVRGFKLNTETGELTVSESTEVWEVIYA